MRHFTPSEAVAGFVESSLDFVNHVFVAFPGTTNHLRWDDKTMAMFRRYIKSDPKAYVYAPINGTMASGDPYTTMMNTLRSLCYTHYYLERSNLQYKVFAAGDDVVIFCRKQDAQTVAQLILNQTSRDHTTDSTLN